MARYALGLRTCRNLRLIEIEMGSVSEGKQHIKTILFEAVVQPWRSSMGHLSFRIRMGDHRWPHEVLLDAVFVHRHLPNTVCADTKNFGQITGRPLSINITKIYELSVEDYAAECHGQQ